MMSLDTMPQNNYSIDIENSIHEIERVQNWLNSIMDQWNIDGSTSFKTELVIHEVLMNIISYAYSDNKPHNIKICLGNSDDEVLLEFVDDGVEFNQISSVDKQEMTNLELVKIGGHGRRLIKNYTHQQSYRRNNENNVLMLSVAK